MNNLIIPIIHLVYNLLRLVTHAKTFSDEFNIQNSFTFDYKEPNDIEILIIILLQIFLFGLEIILKFMIEIIKNYKMF